MKAFNQPLCTCTKEIERKYISLRNEAMNAPETIPTFLNINVQEFEKTKLKYAAQYLNDIISVKHTNKCLAYIEILNYVAQSEAFRLNEKLQLSSSLFDEAMQLSIKKWKTQMQKMKSRLIENTAELQEINPSNYWHYINSLEHLKMYENMEQDTYALKYNSNNSIEFKDLKVNFPFDCYALSIRLCNLREKILQPSICATDLQTIPLQIFEETELKYYPDLAKWTYNVIESWITEYENKVHNGQKKRLFDGFLDNCKIMAMQCKDEVHTEEEYRRIFDKELSVANFPYNDIVKRESNRTELFRQFITAEKKPSFSLFLEDFYTEKELIEGQEHASRNIPVSSSNSPFPVAANFVETTAFERRLNELHREFSDKLGSGQLSKRYYCPNIEKTIIIEACIEINTTFRIMENRVMVEDCDPYKEAEIRAESILLSIRKLNNQEIANEIVNDLLAYNYNIALHFATENKQNLQNRWEAVKNQFDFILRKAYPIVYITQANQQNAKNGKITELYLSDLKKAFNNELDFIKAINMVDEYFQNQKMEIAEPLFVKNGNIKTLAFALGEIWRSQRNEVITCEYLQFYKKAFSIFDKQVIDCKNIFGMPLYKYSISKT